MERARLLAFALLLLLLPASAGAIVFVPITNASSAPVAPGYASGTTGGAGHARFNVNDLGSASTLSTTGCGNDPDGFPFPQCGTLRGALVNASSICRPVANGGDGGCYVTFSVTGDITPAGQLVLIWPNVTIDGSTAPGQGVGLHSDGTHENGIQICASNVIMRYMRIRGGSNSSGGKNAEVNNACSSANISGIWFDHISTSWGRDTEIDISTNYTGGAQGTVSNVTVSNSIMAENLAFGSMLIGGKLGNVTLYRNLLDASGDRNPHIAVGLTCNSYPAPGAGVCGTTSQLGNTRNCCQESDNLHQFPYGWTSETGSNVIEILQNIVYDFIYGTDCESWSGNWTLNCDVIGNLYIQPSTLSGTESTGDKLPINIRKDLPLGPSVTKMYLSGNTAQWAALNTGMPVTTQADLFSQRNNGLTPSDSDYLVGSAAGTTVIPTLTASALEQVVLDQAGATLPCRDSVDLARLGDVLHRRQATGGAGNDRPPQVKWAGGFPDWSTACPVQSY